MELPRRRFVLRALGAGVGVLGIGACAREEPDGIRVPLASLPPGERVETEVLDEPVLLLRRGDEVTATSLWCSHMGCRVQWAAETGTYDCPCHEGRFAADGTVISGPPTAPLRSLPVRIEGDTVLVESRSP